MAALEAESFLASRETPSPVVTEMPCLKTFTRLREDKPFRGKLVHTFCLSWSFVTIGWVNVLAGVSLPDLREIVWQDLDTASWLLTVGAFGQLLGSLVGGSSVDRFNKVKVIATSCLGLSLSLVAIPFCSLFPLMLAAKFINEAFLGGVNTAGNAYLPYIWGSDCASYMQMMHFGVSLGTLLATVVTEPFLSRPYDQSANVSCTNLSASASVADTGHRLTDGDIVHVVAGGGLGLNVSDAAVTNVNTILNVTHCSNYSDLTQLSNGAQQPSQIHFAYLIPGLFMMFASASFFYLNARHVDATPRCSKLGEKAVDATEPESAAKSVDDYSGILV